MGRDTLVAMPVESARIIDNLRVVSFKPEVTYRRAHRPGYGSVRGLGPIAGAVSSATDLSRTDVRCLRALLTLHRIDSARWLSSSVCNHHDWFEQQPRAQARRRLRLRSPGNRHGSSGPLSVEAGQSPLLANYSARIQSDTRSPIMMQVRLMLARGMAGMTDASTTRRLRMARSRQYWSTTAIASPGGPIRAVPQGWNWVATVART